MDRIYGSFFKVSTICGFWRPLWTKVEVSLSTRVPLENISFHCSRVRLSAPLSPGSGSPVPPFPPAGPAIRSPAAWCRLPERRRRRRRRRVCPR